MTKYSNTDSDLIGTWQLCGNNSAIKSVVPVSCGSNFFAFYSHSCTSQRALEDWRRSLLYSCLFLLTWNRQTDTEQSPGRGGGNGGSPEIRSSGLDRVRWNNSIRALRCRVVWQGVGNRGWGGGVKAVSHEMKLLYGETL